MPAKNEQPDFGLPNHVLHELGEHTVGGFAVFFFNPETGMPQHLLFFDSPIAQLAMQKYMTDWLEALHEVQVQGAIDNIQSHLLEPPPDDEEEDEKGPKGPNAGNA